MAIYHEKHDQHVNMELFREYRHIAISDLFLKQHESYLQFSFDFFM